MLAGFQNQTGIQPFHGQLIEYYWQPGVDDDDIGVQLYDSDNEVVFDSDNEGDVLSSGDAFFTQWANCGYSTLPGIWTVVDENENSGPQPEFTDVFNPIDLNNPNSLTAPEGFNGTYYLTFESEVCDSIIEFPLIFWESPRVEVDDYEECDNLDIPIEPVYSGPDELTDLEFYWSLEDCDNTPTCIPNFSGQDTIQATLEVQNDICPSTTVSFEVIITPEPNPQLTDTVLCNGGSHVLDPIAIEHSSYVYNWSNGSSTESITVNTEGNYQVRVTNSCAPEGVTATAAITTADSPTVTYVTDTVICAGDEIELIPFWTDLGSNNVIDWYFSWTDGLGNTQTEVLIETSTAIVFGSDQIPLDVQSSGADIVFTAANLCGVATDTVNVHVEACFLGAYNVITPDGDGGADSEVDGVIGLLGLNEGWQIDGIDGLAGVYVRIFDRWGSLVFEDANYGNANPWRGDNSNGKALQDGVYFYTVSTPREENALQGTVTVLRKK